MSLQIQSVCQNKEEMTCGTVWTPAMSQGLQSWKFYEKWRYVMNNEVRERLAEIESSKKLAFEVVTVTIREKKRWRNILGAGQACVQMPDPWDEMHGVKQAKIRAVKDLLGIPNPHLENIIAHEVSRAQAAA